MTSTVPHADTALVHIQRHAATGTLPLTAAETVFPGITHLTHGKPATLAVYTVERNGSSFSTYDLDAED